MSKALHFLVNHRPFQPSPTSTSRPAPPPWVWPAIVAVACVPFVLTAIGLSIVALRPAPRPAAKVVAVPVIAPGVAPGPAAEVVAVPVTVPDVAPEPAAPVEEIVAAPRPVDIGDASAREQSPAPVAAVVPEEPVKAAPVKPSECDRFGTAIDFVQSPTLAFERAARDRKLVMVLHLAGYFDDPGFT